MLLRQSIFSFEVIAYGIFSSRSTSIVSPVVYDLEQTSCDALNALHDQTGYPFRLFRIPE